MGEIAFVAVQDVNERGIFRYDPGQGLAAVALTGGPILGTGQSFNAFSANTISFNNGGLVSFLAIDGDSTYGIFQQTGSSAPVPAVYHAHLPDGTDLDPYWWGVTRSMEDGSVAFAATVRGKLGNGTFGPNLLGLMRWSARRMCYRPICAPRFRPLA